MSKQGVMANRDSELSRHREPMGEELARLPLYRTDLEITEDVEAAMERHFSSPPLGDDVLVVPDSSWQPSLDYGREDVRLVRTE